MTHDADPILVVDDDEAFRRMMVAAVERYGRTGHEAASGEEALALAAQRRPALVFLDLRLGPNRLDGLATLSALRASDPDLPVVLVTGYGDVKQAVQAMKAGAFDFLEKPVDLSQVRRILDAVAPLDRSADPDQGFAFGGIVPAQGPFRDMLELLELAAPYTVPLLVHGESGTGKELVAAWAHEHGPHPRGPLIKVNCAAIPGELLEAEMFGVEKGAFTGALRATRGRFRDADGGTLLLDEIGEMDLSLQAKLLRVLQDKWVQPVGGSQGHEVDVRVVATTNRDLRQAIERGRFREDLYFRLAVFELVVPPLRDRPADILPLARHLANDFTQGRPVRLDPEMEALLLEHPWTGNVRELRNVMERAVIVARGSVLQPAHLPPGFGRGEKPPPVPAAPGRSTLQEQERRLILDTLAANGGNRTQTARDLGLSRRALYYKLERYGIQ